MIHARAINKARRILSNPAFATASKVERAAMLLDCIGHLSLGEAVFIVLRIEGTPKVEVIY